MLVEKPPLELERSPSAPTPPPRSPRRAQVIRPERQGFVAEDQSVEDYLNELAQSELDAKNGNTLEEFPPPQFPQLTHPPSYEESETTGRVDENAPQSPHEVTVRSISISEPSSLPKHPHVWQIKRTTVTLSALEATVLVKAGIFSYKDLRLYKSTTKLNDQGPTDPLSGAFAAVFGTVGDICLRAADYPLIVSSVLNPPPGSTANSEAKNFACDPEKGVTGMVGVALKAPIDVTYNMARGFHNLPKAYGDRMVRRLDPITGAGSGFKAAGKEFGLGLWDGVSGLVTQPVKGAQETGALGCMKGFGKGIAGVAFKPAAGTMGLVGYSGRGMYESVQKATNHRSKKALREAQIVQGMQLWEVASEETKSGILQKAKEDLEEFDRTLAVVKLL